MRNAYDATILIQGLAPPVAQKYHASQLSTRSNVIVIPSWSPAALSCASEVKNTLDAVVLYLCTGGMNGQVHVRVGILLICNKRNASTTDRQRLSPAGSTALPRFLKQSRKSHNDLA